MVPVIKTFDVSPVCHYHSIPVQALFQPVCKKFPVGMERHTVIAGRTDHNSERTGLHRRFERLEILFLDFTSAEHCRSAVLSGFGSSVGEEMLNADCHIFRANRIRVTSLQSTGQRHAHTALHERVLAEALPHSRPTLVSAQIEGWSEHPGNIAGPCFIGTYSTYIVWQIIVERRRQTYLVREKNGSESIRCSVNLVQAIQTRYSGLVH